MAGRCAAAWCTAAGLWTACPAPAGTRSPISVLRTVFDLRAAHERTGQATGAVRVGVDVVQIRCGRTVSRAPPCPTGVFSATGRTPEQSVAAYATAKVAAYVAMVCLCTRFRRGHRGVVGTGNAAGGDALRGGQGPDGAGRGDRPADAGGLRGLGARRLCALPRGYLRGPCGPVSAPAGTIGRFPRAVRPGLCRPPPALLAAPAATTAGWGSVGGYLAGPGAVRPGVAESLRARLLAW